MQFLFEDQVLDTDRWELHRGSTPIAVQRQVFDILTYLLENRDRVVSKEDLIAAVWNGRIVSESALNSRINATRRAVGDTGEEQRLIRTVFGKGFRFVGDVRVRSSHRPPAPVGPLKNGGTEQPRAALTLPDRPAIAVLPFANMSGDPEQEYFSDGISEDIVTALSRLRWFFVIARNSSFAYRGRPIPLKQIGEELGVSYLVEGSVRKSGDRVRISAQLNEVATGNQLWAERYDRGLADVFAVQDEITDAIVAAIEPQVYAAENFRARRKPPESLDAWDLVMRAMAHLWRVTREDHVMGQALLERAIAIDPNYAQALAVLAVSHVRGLNAGFEEDTAISVATAERAALAAIRADSEDPWAHLAVAGVHLYSGRFEDALGEFEQALYLNPNFALAQAYYGLALSYAGRWEEGANAARRALRLSPRDPFSPICNSVAASAEFRRGNYHEAIRLARESLRQRAGSIGALRVLTASAAMAGEIEFAKASLQQLRRVQPNISLAWIVSQMPPNEVERERYLEALRRAGLE